MIPYPGRRHEIAGVVTEVGASVARFKPGDRVGVGCMVNSYRSWDRCAGGFWNLCRGVVRTYNLADPRDGAAAAATHGGYSSAVVVHERFVMRFPAGVPLDRGAPLLCAGVTVHSPLRRHGLGAPGKYVGVAGLGHVAVKFARALGARVTVVSSSPAKRREALERLGADAFVLSSDADEMKAAAGTMDGIINTVSANIPLTPLLGLLKPNGKMVLVGMPEKPWRSLPSISFSARCLQLFDRL
jgi:cinnamyl-alcohol dehydrogenase